MSDIVEELRGVAVNSDNYPLCQAAAAEIELLRSRLANLRRVAGVLSPESELDYHALKVSIQNQTAKEPHE